MIQRIRVLSRFLFRRLLTSAAGALYILSAFAVWLIFFNPNDGRVPDGELFVLLVGMYGAILSFVVTLSLAARANSAESYAMFVRLPSRVEYLASVFWSAIKFVVLIQVLFVLVVLIQPNGPELSFGRIIEIPPLWLSVNILAIVLALHATDFVMSGWSRVYVFGILTLLLFSQSIDNRGIRWMADRFNGMASSASQRGWTDISRGLRDAATWVSANGLDFLSNTIGVVFWPFRAISSAVQDGMFDNAQALAPAILLLYATILFMLAADLFATKDLFLAE